MNQTLIDAANLINKPFKWTQRAFARDKHGESCMPEEGYCWCAIGAIIAATPDNDKRIKAEQLLDAHPEVAKFGRVSAWNDSPGQTRENVVRVMREAAASTPRSEG